jgi:peptidoglycan/xylan/chitin deacetylase (PgdA/CDA1 family)
MNGLQLMTTFLPAYDTESPDCLAGVRRIVQVHERLALPATFFFVAGLLDQQQAEYVALLRNHPLFEIACHSYTHMPIVDAPRFCTAGPRERFPYELIESKKRIEDVYGNQVIGFRPPCSGPEGLLLAPDALALLHEAGYGYVSSFAWGPDGSLPAPLRHPFTYKEQGFESLWEIPACGWHENLLKGHNNIGPVLLCLFPPEMPETIPSGYVQTPAEEFSYNNKPYIDRAVTDDMPVVSLIWHPWSLHRFDPEMQMLEMTFSYLEDRQIPCLSFQSFWKNHLL